MKTHFADWDDQTLAMAVDLCTDGLDRAAGTALQGRVDSADLEEFELAVAALQLAHLPPLERPSADALRRVEQNVMREIALRATIERRPARFPWGSVSGWLVAAAILAVFVVRDFAGAPDPFDAYRELTAAADAVLVAWQESEDPAALDATGDVVWSPARQEGYMRFENLAPNDPTKEQYQLWIFDSTRADWEAKPVDGGVFDVEPDRGGVAVVPIDPKLGIGQAALFAVTLEKPGGVVVSERDRLVLLASL